MGVQNAALLELPPRETLADLVLGAEPSKRDVGPSFRLTLRSREPMLSRLIPDKRLPCFHLTAELARVIVLACDCAGALVPRQVIGPRSRDRKEDGLASMNL
jgi:hypothetical protein